MTYTVSKNRSEETDISEQFIDIDDPVELLDKAADEFSSRIALLSSFSLEDAALIHMLFSSGSLPSCQIVAIDTGRLPEESFQCAEVLKNKYDLSIEWLLPDTKAVEELVSRKGQYSFKESVENRKECCFIRKVEPLNRKLKLLDAWVTGQRREHSPTRELIQPVEIDRAHGSILKFNPLYDWSTEKVWSYVKENNIPYSRLYNLGYKSIGCAPCSRPVSSDEHERAGRWWWESAEHKECGIHLTGADRASGD